MSSPDPDALAADVERDGICVLRGLLPEVKVARWKEAFDRLYEARAQIPNGLAPRGPSRHYLTLPWVEPFADPEVFAHPAILRVLDRVFGQEYVMVQLGADVAGPGSEAQDVHRDHQPLFGDDFVTPLYALAVNFPLVPVTEETVRSRWRAVRTCCRATRASAGSSPGRTRSSRFLRNRPT